MVALVRNKSKLVSKHVTVPSSAANILLIEGCVTICVVKRSCSPLSLVYGSSVEENELHLSWSRKASPTVDQAAVYSARDSRLHPIHDCTRAVSCEGHGLSRH